MTPWQLPADVALGMMANLGVANAWKAVPIMQGVGIVMSGKDALTNFAPSLVGKKPSVKAQIAASLDALRTNQWQSR